MGNPLIKPKRLLPGDTIGVVAPAGYVDHNTLHRGVEQLARLGFHVLLGRHVEKRYRYLAGVDAERAEDLQTMIQNPEIRAIFCARGGFGTARVIPYLQTRKIVGSPKIFMGSSDITTLLIWLTHTVGWVAFHGPMVATQFGQHSTKEAEDIFLRVLSGDVVEMNFPGVIPLRGGTAQGVLTGGCLTLLCTTIKTAYEIDTEDRILFLEDTDEAPYRIDRMLTYLKGLKKFDHVRGVIFGQMSKCQPDQLPEIILDVLGEFDFPILFGFPSGHGDATATLPFGIPVAFDTTNAILKMREPAVSA